tara:strand:- start:113 stop:343 length:231 start_codon:yes stop_codon:yes gene_type:complete
VSTCTEHWVTTKEAEEILGIPRRTLKRSYADPDKGFLVEGTHWKKGMYHTSTRYWEINRCKATLLKQGFMFTKVTQ